LAGRSRDPSPLLRAHDVTRPREVVPRAKSRLLDTPSTPGRGARCDLGGNRDISYIIGGGGAENRHTEYRLRSSRACPDPET
ncbi:hypothetical protein BaRGS_00040518, partial [Batillaria attramentaria]